MKKGSTILLMALAAVISFGLGYSFRGTRLTGDTAAARPTTAANNPNPNAPAAPPADKTVYRVPVGTSPAKGPDDAQVTVVIFSDFQCPFCSRVEPTLKSLEDDYKGKIRFVWKNNPLPFHQNAGPSAEAAMAASDQGKFWEMHDKLFADQQHLDRPTFEKYAQDLGLNMDKFKASLDANSHKNVIEEDKTLASTLGASGTPSFFINGRPLRGAQPLPQFKAVVDEEVAKADALTRQGTKKSDVYAELTKNGLAKAEAAKQAAPASPAGRRKVEFAKDDPMTGGKNPKVTIVEFSDFQCPFCQRAEGTVKQILSTYKDDIKVVYLENPLPFHNNAAPAAEAALAAHEQGKFWQMHDKMFANNTALDRPNLEKYAGEIGLNMQKFKAALDANKFKSRIDDTIKLANANGAGGTPAFFINGKLISGAQPFENFKTVIDAEIAHADDLVKKGTKRENLYAEIMKEASAAPPAAAPAANDEDSKPANVAIGDSPVKGDPKAPVTIVEFSDYQCPFCGRVEGTLTQVMNDYKGKVKLTFKNQPLPFHNNAMIAAQGALAAKEQGKFWEMHDKMYANQQALTRDNIMGYAKELGLDTGKFEKDIDSQKVKDAIAKDQGEAQKAAANGTPTFFINGHRVVGAVPVENFKTVIDEELKKSGKGS